MKNCTVFLAIIAASVLLVCSCGSSKPDIYLDAIMILRSHIENNGGLWSVVSYVYAEECTNGICILVRFADHSSNAYFLVKDNNIYALNQAAQVYSKMDRIEEDSCGCIEILSTE